MLNNETEIPAVVGSSSAPPWIELPEDVTASILRRLGAVEILESAHRVCTTWWRVCQDPAMWRIIDLHYSPGSVHLVSSHRWMRRLARHAVDLSRGELVDLRVAYFGGDELLNYTVNRSSHLRRLTLDSCIMISAEALAEAVEKLPGLEALHLFNMSYLEAEDVAAIGSSCPALKAFTFNEEGFRRPLPKYSEDDDDLEGVLFDYNEHAVAIARTMPNLSLLRLLGHWLKNEGLEAILDGCPRLEFLDLGECFNLDLRGDLGKRCSEQIKYLRREPDRETDSEDYEELFGSEDSDDYSIGFIDHIISDFDD